jgi:hypothetical protein
MYLTSCIKLVEHQFSLYSGGLTWMFAGRPIPKEKWKKYMSFWSAVIWKVGHTLKNQIKVMLQTWLGTHFFELLVDIFFWVIDTLTTLDTDLCKIETSRDPPKIFIPIPKIESNGCARSDLLICLLIF